MATDDDRDNPYRAPAPVEGPAEPFGDLPVTLVERSPLRLKFCVETAAGVAEVVYDGWGLYEEIRVNGNVAARDTRWLWFVPHFDFQLAGHPATVDLAFRPWFAIRSFRFAIDGHSVYEERRFFPVALLTKLVLMVATCLFGVLGSAGVVGNLRFMARGQGIPVDSMGRFTYLAGMWAYPATLFAMAIACGTIAYSMAIKRRRP